MKSSLHQILETQGLAPVMWDSGQEFSGVQLLRTSHELKTLLLANGVEEGQIVAFQEDFSERSVALFIAVLDIRAIPAPLPDAPEEALEDLMGAAHASWFVTRDFSAVNPVGVTFSPSPLVEELTSQHHSGFVVMSSGTSGKPKALLHDLDRTMTRFTFRKRDARVALFLRFDHFGGINTMLGSIFSGATGIALPSRQPKEVLGALKDARVSLFPTTPSYLRLLLMGKEFSESLLPNLKTISFGTERMPPRRHAQKKQTFPETLGLAGKRLLLPYEKTLQHSSLAPIDDGTSEVRARGLRLKSTPFRRSLRTKTLASFVEGPSVH